jgi:hypothetical protein
MATEVPPPSGAPAHLHSLILATAKLYLHTTAVMAAEAAETLARVEAAAEAAEAAEAAARARAKEKARAAAAERATYWSAPWPAETAHVRCATVVLK